MRPVTVTASAVAASAPVVLDYLVDDFKVGIVVKVTGTITYTVQYTMDDPFASGGLTGATWIDSSDTGVVGATATKATSFTFPVRAVRVNNTAGTGSTSMTVVMGGIS